MPVTSFRPAAARPLTRSAPSSALAGGLQCVFVRARADRVSAPQGRRVAASRSITPAPPRNAGEPSAPRGASMVVPDAPGDDLAALVCTVSRAALRAAKLGFALGGFVTAASPHVRRLTCAHEAAGAPLAASPCSG